MFLCKRSSFFWILCERSRLLSCEQGVLLPSSCEQGVLYLAAVSSVCWGCEQGVLGL